MAIQNRRGNKVDFDPYKMLPGEWAVSIDSETENQIVWMCFRAGVVKRMGTYEDFREQVMEISEEIAKEFEETFSEIKIYMEGLRDTTKGYMDTTEGYKDTSVQKATEASTSASSAKTSEENASKSAISSANSADLSEEYAEKAKSYAVGTGGEVRPNDDTDCASFYYEQVKRISQGVEGIIPMGTITFAELDLPHNQIPKYMFDISDDFVSDERFKNGSGIYYGAGSNVIRTADDMWDVLTPVSVMGVKGDKEETYRQGFVNLTPADIGAVSIEDYESGGGGGTGGTVGNLDPNKALISDADGNVVSSNVTSGELEFLSGARSNLQQQIDDLPDLSNVNADFVGTKAELEEKVEAGEMEEGTTIYLTDGEGGEGSGGSGGTIGNLEPNKAVVTDSDGNIAASQITSAEIGYLSGAKSNIQKQIDDFQDNLNISKYVYIEWFIRTDALLDAWELSAYEYIYIWSKMYDGITGEYLGKAPSPDRNIIKYVPLSFSVIPFADIFGTLYPVESHVIGSGFFSGLGVDTDLTQGIFKFTNRVELSENPFLTWYKVYDRQGNSGDINSLKESPYKAFLFRGYLKKLETNDPMYIGAGTKTLTDAESSIS